MSATSSLSHAPGGLLSDPAPGGLTLPRVVAALLLAAAVILRGLYFALPELNADMAMWGLQALDIIHGRFHLFFSGELFGGSLEAWLAAPIFALFGPSARALSVVPFTFSLVMVWAVWRLARVEMGPWPGILALAWVAVPPYYLAQHSVWPLGAYIEVPCLAVLCLGLSLRMDRQMRLGRAQRLASFWLGLAWGVGLWTHLLMLPAVIVTGGWLLLRHPRRMLGGCLPWLGAGALLGGLPLWVVSIPAGLLQPEVLGQGRQVQLGPAWQALWEQGVPMVLGLMEPRYLGSNWTSARLGVWVLYGLVICCLGAIWLTGRVARPPRGGALVGISLLYVMTYVVVWLFSGAYSQGTWRHLTPLYAGAPFLVAACVTGRSDLTRGLGLTLGLIALGLNLWGCLQMAPWLSSYQREVYQDRRKGEQELFARLRAQETPNVYAQWFWDALPLSLSSGGDVTFADQVENHLPRLTQQADASPRPAYVLTTREEDFRNTLAAAGVISRGKQVAHFLLHTDFQRPMPALRQVPTADWTSPQPGGERAWDRDLSTAYTDGISQQIGQTFTVDLGRVQPDLCLLELMPGPYAEAAAGLELLTSTDGQTWQAAASQKGTAFGPVFWSLDRPLLRFLPARQQLAFPPRAARYLQIRQTAQAPGRWWSLAELFLYQGSGATQGAPSPQQLAQAILALPGQGKVFAPPEVLALLPPARRALEPPQLPPSTIFPLEKLRLPLESETVLCLPGHEWEAGRELLESHLVVPPLALKVGSWALITDLRPREPSLLALPLPAQATARASLQGELAPGPLRHPPGQRWHTGQPQAPGQWYEIDLGQEMTIAGLSLDTGDHSQDGPMGLQVEIRSGDGAWREMETVLTSDSTLVWGGERVLKGGGTLWVNFPPQAVRGLRLTQTGSHPRLHWTIAGVGLLEQVTPEE